MTKNNDLKERESDIRLKTCSTKVKIYIPTRTVVLLATTTSKRESNEALSLSHGGQH